MRVKEYPELRNGMGSGTSSAGREFAGGPQVQMFGI